MQHTNSSNGSTPFGPHKNTFVSCYKRCCWLDADYSILNTSDENFPMSVYQLTVNIQRCCRWRPRYEKTLSFFLQHVFSSLFKAGHLPVSEDHYISLALTTHLYKCQTGIHFIWTDIAPWKGTAKVFPPLCLLLLIWFVGQIVSLICFFLTAWVRGVGK